MSRKNKLLIVLLAVIFCFSAFSISVLAVGENGDESGYSDLTPDDNQGGDEENGDNSGDIPPENSGSDSNNNDENSGDNNSDNSGDNNGGDNSSDIGDGNIDNNDNGYSDNNGGDNNSYDPDYNSGYDEQGGYDSDYVDYGEPSYVGGGQTYIPPENTAPSAALYDSKGSINEKTLSNSDWSDISERLKNASNSVDDGDDFAFIQNNNSLSDNGGWMLIASILCFAFSAAGIVYFIVLTVQNKKKCNFATTATDIGRVSKSSASHDYYGDGYKSNLGKSSNNHSKFDTAEVKLPKSAQGKRYKNGGKRYK